MRIIDADPLIERVKQEPTDGMYTHEILEAINEQPTINPESIVKRGQWVENEDFNNDTYYDCSVCGESFCFIEGYPDDNLYKYCPNCGAKMMTAGD